MSRGQGSPVTAMVQPGALVEGVPETAAGEVPLNPRPGGGGGGGVPGPATPPDLCTMETLVQCTRQLHRENVSLREAIRQSNEALRERCEELQQFQAWSRRERELVLSRFGQARRLVERLRAANSQLQRRLGEGGPEVKVAAAGGGSAESSLASYTTITESMFNCPAPARAEEPRGQEREADRPGEGAAEQPPLRSPAPQDRPPGADKHLEQLQNRLKQQEAEFEVKVQGLSRQVEQLSDDRSSLKAQVTSLLAELVESQSTAESVRRHGDALQEKCQALEERLRVQEKEAEAQRKQSSVTIDQLRIVAHNSESALKTERQNASEDKRKLAQLQAAYHQLFAEYDLTVKDGKRNRGQADDIGEQLREAEAALAMKQELIDKLKDEAETMKSELETIPVLKAQAEVFKADFLAERAAREQLHQQKELQQERLQALQLEFDKMRAEHEVATRAHIEELQRRHSDSLRTPVGGPGNYFQNGSTIPFHVPAEPPLRHAFPDEQPDFRCPKCQYQAPDMDTLQIHVMDCIQ